MYVDSHCHLQLLDLDLYSGGLDQVVEQARRYQVHHMLCVAVDFGDHEKLQQICQQYEDVTMSVGVHPTHLPELKVTPSAILDKVTEKVVVAIGETGLDYYRTPSEDLDWQRERFVAHIEAAKACQKPLIIHSRAAKEDTLSFLKDHGADSVGGVLHCFTEDWDMAERALTLNFYVSFSGIVTFKNAKAIQEVALKLPLNRMLIETDCPYLAPVPLRGKPNEPANLRHTAQFIADLRDVSVETIAQATTDNFNRLFLGEKC